MFYTGLINICSGEKKKQEWCLKGNDVRLYWITLSEVEMPEKFVSGYIFDLITPGSLHNHRIENGTLRVWFLTWVPSDFPWNILSDKLLTRKLRYGHLPLARWIPCPGAGAALWFQDSLLSACAKNKCTSNIISFSLKCVRSLFPSIPGLLPKYHPEDSLEGLLGNLLLFFSFFIMSALRKSNMLSGLTSASPTHLIWLNCSGKYYSALWLWPYLPVLYNKHFPHPFFFFPFNVPSALTCYWGKAM